MPLSWQMIPRFARPVPQLGYGLFIYALGPFANLIKIKLGFPLTVWRPLLMLPSKPAVFYRIVLVLWMVRWGRFPDLAKIKEYRMMVIKKKKIHVTTFQSVIISHHITSHHITSHHIASHHITPYHIISYHIISYHIISYHIISYHIISYHIISYHIISYRIVSYRIVSYHIISYNIFIYPRILE